MSDCDSQIIEIGWDKNDNPCQFVPAEFARQLERERDEARARVEIITPSKNNPVAEFFLSSNTPETDAAVKDSNGQWSFVLKETCQRLERERDEAREVASGLAAQAERLKRERDDALAQIFQAECRAERFCQERDEAQKHLRDIEEYGTEEINDAVELRQKLAAALRERDEAREALENHMAATIHTCHDECKRPMCVLRRERDEAREDSAHWKVEYEIVGARLCGWKHPRDNGIIFEHEIIPKLTQERDKALEDARLLSERLTRLELDSAFELAKLERERDEAREDLKITQKSWVKAKTERVEALRERDKAMEDATNFYAKIGELRSERDNAPGRAERASI